MLLMNSRIGYFEMFNRTENENGALITLYAKGERDKPYKLFLIHDQWPLKCSNTLLFEQNSLERRNEKSKLNALQCMTIDDDQD